MSKFNAQNYFPVLIIIFFLVAAAGGGSLIYPKFRELKAMEGKISAAKEEIKLAENYYKKLKDIKLQLETDYLAAIAKIDTALPFEFSVPSFMKFLQEASVQSGVALKSVGLPAEGPFEEPALRTLKVSLGLEGSYAAFKNFLSVLENSSRLIEVNDMSFSKDESAEEQKSVSFSLQISAFGY